MSDENKKNRRKKNTNLYICIALTLCLLTIAVIAAVSASMTHVDISVPDVSIGGIVKPSESSVPEETPSKDNPVDADVSGVDASVTPVYTYPVEGGYIAKQYSIDALVFSQTMKDWRTHNGIDIAGEVGQAVHCFADGVILSVISDPLMGTTVTVDHGEGLMTRYMNLNESLPAAITEGSVILSGAKIGMIGTNAIAESADKAHLHFEVTKDGAYADPIDYLLLSENKAASGDAEQ